MPEGEGRLEAVRIEVPVASKKKGGTFHIDYSVDPPTLNASFPRDEVADALVTGDAVDFTVSGEMMDGTTFIAAGTLRVIDPGRSTLRMSASPRDDNPAPPVISARRGRLSASWRSPRPQSSSPRRRGT